MRVCYGVPVPERTAGGYRLYSEDDVRLLRRLHELTEDGVPISEAVRLAVENPPETAEQPAAAAPSSRRWGRDIVAPAMRLDRRAARATVRSSGETLTVSRPAPASAGPKLQRLDDVRARHAACRGIEPRHAHSRRHQPSAGPARARRLRPAHPAKDGGSPPAHRRALGAARCGGTERATTPAHLGRRRMPSAGRRRAHPLKACAVRARADRHRVAGRCVAGCVPGGARPMS
jgi:DNA-binding transcriptional MerR regulator